MIVVRGVLCATVALPAVAHAFGFDDVALRAKSLMAQAYKAPEPVVPSQLRDLDYDQLRDIRFRPQRALWRADKLPFEVMFFHPGRNFDTPVLIHTIDPGGVHDVEFDPSMFDYGRNQIDPQGLRRLGFAGFRVHFAVNKPSYKDEVLVFLGASYFRAIGASQVYGLSARGLALDTASAQGEEFPHFREFWIERPRPGATSLTIYALLDTAQLAGAYQFVLTPGSDSVMQVAVRLYPRQTLGKLGLAPLNSMYAFGENQPGRDDYRPEVHDSDGLSLQNGDGEWIWRPLVNPKRLLVTSFMAKHPKGFGLLQRDRSPASYEDPEALYERRPSAWVEPVGDWGTGRVELVQIPTPDETNDNIVAYWVPDQRPAARQPYTYRYRLHWQLNPAGPADKGWVVQTRRGRGYVKKPDGDLNFVVDFDGPALRAIKPDARIEPSLEVSENAQLRENNLFRNPVTGVWRMTVRIQRTDVNKPVELRAFLRRPHESALTETWCYIVPAEPDKP